MRITLRWIVLSLLVIELGPGAVQVVEHHALGVSAVVVGLGIIGFWLWWRKKRRTLGELAKRPDE